MEIPLTPSAGFPKERQAETHTPRCAGCIERAQDLLQQVSRNASPVVCNRDLKPVSFSILSYSNVNQGRTGYNTVFHNVQNMKGQLPHRESRVICSCPIQQCHDAVSGYLKKIARMPTSIDVFPC